MNMLVVSSVFLSLWGVLWTVEAIAACDLSIRRAVLYGFNATMTFGIAIASALSPSRDLHEAAGWIMLAHVVMCFCVMVKHSYDDAAWLDMLEERNRTSHTYRESMAEEVFVNLPRYLPLLTALHQKLAARLQEIQSS